ncbi:MAG: ribonucleoside-diphosphate reductase subunit alpha [Hahellaceae bacterium]|nr:ribonucleoside-diphosphate reductase subunit alpha [Hahellaceae bacterium]
MTLQHTAASAMPTSRASSFSASKNASDTAPLRAVIKRDGTLAPFDAGKIADALTRAILAVEGPAASGSSRIRECVSMGVRDIEARLFQRYPEGAAVPIEDIQDLAELALMRQGLYAVARAYVLYREEHARKRQSESSLKAVPNAPTVAADPLQERQREAHALIERACEGLEGVDMQALIEQVRPKLHARLSSGDLATVLIMTVRPMIEVEPAYSRVAARLLLENASQEVRQALRLSASTEQNQRYQNLLETGIRFAVEVKRLSPDMLQFDLARLSEALHPERDLQFDYLGLQTLYDRYFLHHQGQRLELPQTFFMRVAMGLALREDDPTARAIEFYELLSSFDYLCSTPTLFNAGTLRPQLSSCYLTTVPDSLDGIYSSLRDNALLSKFAGGLGNDWTPVRGLGAHIQGTNGQSQGVVPFLKVVNDTAVAVNQGGKRKGAVCAYLETWHLDVEDFLDLRKNTGDERRRTHDMNTAHWIPDLFMQRVFEDQSWTLFSPDQVPDLHDCYGRDFEARYSAYERQTESGEITLFKRVKAIELWRRMLAMVFETGHPWLTFKDPCNLRSPQQHVGVVHSSNLCTEITLNTQPDEIAVCNLGSINLVNHLREGKLDTEKLRRTVTTAVRMLDNVIDLNFYAVEAAARGNLKHRPVGLGLMGFQDALYALDIPYASVEAVTFADQSMEWISYLAIEASSDLAELRGRYESYPGSLWSQGVFPIDSQEKLATERGAGYWVANRDTCLDWNPLREKVTNQGMRNSNVLAIAPTATISNIVGVSQSIEPTYQNLYVKSNLSGEFTLINPWLVKELKALDLWDQVMVNDLKYYDGRLSAITRIPEDVRRKYATAFEIDSRWLIEAAARRQKWIDQAQSLNLYVAEPSGKYLDNLYKTAWTRGLKTTYYLRSLGATHVDKSVEEASSPPMVCSIDNPDCEACQ